jgi:hypothetical protein
MHFHVKQTSVRLKASNRESIVHSEQAGLLTCNRSHHPAHSSKRIVDTFDENLLLLLTVARQLVIYTRFPINLQLSKTFSDDVICKEQSCNVEIITNKVSL